MTDLNKMFIVPCTRAARDYDREVRLDLWAMGVPAGFGLLAWIIFGKAAGPGSIFFGLAAILTAAAVLWALNHIPAVRREKGLYLKTKGREFILTPAELSCSIGMLDSHGPALACLRKEREPYLRVAWKEISSFKVEKVIRGQPPVWKRVYSLQLTSGGQVAIHRSYFTVNEPYILKELERRLAPMKIQVKDEPTRRQELPKA